ncbi:MAG: tetratricopeptide repeat protein [Nitrosomonas sp.]|nr:tetratricopeptide repeat protein [Nitrosomonas sp.]
MNLPPPQVFVSATTSDLGTCRQIIKEALLTLGCTPVEQTNFPPDAGTVREMLQKKIAACQAVIHVVGEVYGAEPKQQSVGEPRRSYTQMEYDIAYELGKDVYLFICGKGFDYDEYPSEGEEAQRLQQNHRNSIRNGDHLYNLVASREELKFKVSTLQIRTHQLSKALEATQKERDEALSRIQQTTDYQDLKEKVEIAKRNVAKLPGDPDFAKELQCARENLENFTQGILKLAEEIKKIPLNSARGIKARAYFDKGDYQAARDALDDKEMAEEKQALLRDRVLRQKKEAEAQARENDLATDYILKARLTAVDYQLGDQRIPQTRQSFEEALELARTPDHLFGYAYFLQQHNQFSDSEKLYREALKAYRDLAQANSTDYQSHVARTLNNLGMLVSEDSRRRNEAERFYQEALNTYRELVKANPAVYLPDVATTLNNLGVLVADDSGRRDQAETLYQEALTIQRELAQGSPVEYRSDVAATLNNLGVLVKADSGRRDEAEELYQEALTIRRELAQTNPAVYLPDVAMTLNNLGLLVADDSYRRHEAEKLYQEALTIRRELVQANPAVYRPDVANTLNNLGVLVKADSDRRDEAEELYLEALTIRRELSEVNPTVYQPDVAMTLYNLGLLIAENSHRRNDAEKLYQEALTIRRELAQANPAMYRPDVANTLNNLGVLVKADSGRRDEVEELYLEALTIRRELAQANPVVYQPDVAMTLYNLGLLIAQDSIATMKRKNSTRML